MSASSRVGVLTFHRCINYGSYWQARALVDGLRARGVEAVLLDHRSRRVNRAEWRCALSPHLPAPTRPAHRVLYARKTRAFQQALRKLPLSQPFSLDAPGGMEPFDLVLVGSDEVWNRRHPWYGGSALFYGAGLRARRLGAYAASFGNHRAEDGLPAELAAHLERFEAISVRDDNSRRLIRDNLGQEVDLVLDPCLQFDAVHPVRAGASSDRVSDRVIVYGHSFEQWFAEGVRAWADARGCRLLSLGYHNDWADEQLLDAGPEAFSREIAGARAVATTFFHGCVFALLHGKPFVCAASDYRANKVRSLVRSLGADRHLMEEAMPRRRFFEALDPSLDAGIVARIRDLRSRSDTYLDHVLH